MECSNCGFQNLPGLETCGRCGASLRLATADIDVHPPRASAAAKQWRRTSTYRLLNPVIETAAERGADLATAVGDIPDWKEIARSLIPGLPQWAAGQRLWSRILAGTYTGLLVLSLLNFGTVFGSVVLGLLLSCHAASIWDAAAQAREPLARAVRTLWFATACALVVYGPPYWLVSNVAEPVAIRLPREPFERGDVVLMNCRAFARGGPRVGEVVLFAVPRNTVRTSSTVRGNQQYAIVGERIDRVLATAGQVVELRDGLLYVDDIPAAVRPLNSLPLPSGFRVQVPARHCLVLPSADLLGASLSLEQFVALAQVPWESIRGRVYLRIHPLSRWEVIR